MKKYFTIISTKDPKFNEIKDGMNTFQLEGNVSQWHNTSGIRFHDKDITMLFREEGMVYEVSDFKFTILLSDGCGVLRTDAANMKFIGSIMNLDTVKYMIENGIDINSDNGYFAFWFCRHGDSIILKYLLENGLNLKVCGQECLRAACENGNIDKVKLLVEYGVDI